MENKAMDRPRASSFPTENKWLDRFFNSPLDEFFNFGKVVNVPAVNVSENENEYKLCIAAPGLEKKDFKVEMREDLLTISAEKIKEEKEEKGRYNRREYNYSSWSRSFTLPEDVEGNKIDARYENGELKISIPKTAGKEKKNVKSISVN